MKRNVRSLLVLTLGLLWLLPAAAQESENIGVMVKITPKAGHDEALITAITDYHKWMANFDGAMRYNWYRVVTGPDSGMYYAYSGGHDWKDFDAEYDWQEESWEVFERNVMPHIDDMYRIMVRTMTDMSHFPESWDGYTHYHLTDWYVKNGQYGAFRSGLKRIVDALKAGGSKNYWGFHAMESGARAGQILLFSPTRGWSGLSETDPTFSDIMVKELGGEEAFNEFMEDWGDTFWQGDSYTVRWLPGASDYGDD